jgi:Tat protein secretion system quality control protein TatD with DNase activity
MWDAHVHWDAVGLEDLRDMWLCAARRGVTGGIVPGVWGRARKVNFLEVNLSQANLPEVNLPCTVETLRPKFFYGAGLHPWELGERWVGKKGKGMSLDEFVLSALHSFRQDIFDNNVPPLIDVIGETGFDLSNHFVRRMSRFGVTKSQLIQMQVESTEAHVEVAVKLGKPLVLHSVGAPLLTINLCKVAKKRGVPQIMVHAFSESKEVLSEFVKEGVYLSFGKNASVRGKTREAWLNCPLEWALLETDAPSNPQCAQHVVPEDLIDVLQSLSEVRNLEPSVVRKMSQMNLKTFLGISISSQKPD